MQVCINLAQDISMYIYSKIMSHKLLGFLGQYPHQLFRKTRFGQFN